jgi:hypothetical protein
LQKAGRAHPHQAFPRVGGAPDTQRRLRDFAPIERHGNVVRAADVDREPGEPWLDGFDLLLGVLFRSHPGGGCVRRQTLAQNQGIALVRFHEPAQADQRARMIHDQRRCMHQRVGPAEAILCQGVVLLQQCVVPFTGEGPSGGPIRLVLLSEDGRCECGRGHARNQNARRDTRMTSKKHKQKNPNVRHW